MDVIAQISRVGSMLRDWRNVRGRSQLELSLQTEVSQRHISFIESGRSQPSRAMLLDLAEALDVPLRDRNALLLAAGYAPVFPEDRWDSQEMAVVHLALRQMLKQHDPFPAIVMDRYWNVLLANASAPQFFGTFFDMPSWKGPRNILHLMFDPDGMRPFVVDFSATAKRLIQRVHREAVGGMIDPTTRQLLDALGAYRSLETDSDDRFNPNPHAPVIPIRFRHSLGTLSYFSLITTVGTPLAAAVQELRVECMYPADPATERIHHKIMSRFIAGEPH